VKTRFVGPADYDMTAMISTLEEVIAQKPAGLLVVGFDQVLKPSIDKAVDAGIPTVTLDGEVYDSKRQIFLGTGNFAAGQKGAKTLIDAIGGSGQVVIVTKVGQGNLEERISGYKATIDATNGAVQLAEVLNDDSDPAKAAAAVASALGKYPDLKGIACVEASGGVGSATAIKEAGKVGKIIIVSMDRDDGTLNFIKDGTITASIAQKTALMPYLGVAIMKAYNDHRVAITKDDVSALVTPLPNSVDTGSEVITKDNVDFWFHG
jgi:ribose transport system substrate-binding protein